jgi:hypothetical protein
MGGGNKGEEGGGGGEATTPLLEDPPAGTITLQKRKVYPKKPSARKKMGTNKPQLEATLMEDDISLVCRDMEDASKDILYRYGKNNEELYGRIENELKEVQQDFHLVHAIPTTSQIA